MQDFSGPIGGVNLQERQRVQYILYLGDPSPPPQASWAVAFAEHTPGKGSWAEQRSIEMDLELL